MCLNSILDTYTFETMEGTESYCDRMGSLKATNTKYLKVHTVQMPKRPKTNALVSLFMLWELVIVGCIICNHDSSSAMYSLIFSTL